MEGNILLNKHTQMMNNKIKLYILGMPMNKLGNWLIHGLFILPLYDYSMTSDLENLFRNAYS